MEIFEFKNWSNKDWRELSKLRSAYPHYGHGEVNFEAASSYIDTRLVSHGADFDGALDVFEFFEQGIGPIKECSLLLARYLESDKTSEKVMGLGLSSNILETISKIRAFRSLMLALEDLYQKKFDIKLLGKSRLAEFSIFDSKMNVLRSFTHLYGGILSGCDYLMSYQHDYYKKEKSVEAQRILETSFQILIEESQLGAVKDPFAGSYLVEEMTKNIAQKSWELTKIILSEGGYQKFLESDKFKSWLKNSKDNEYDLVFNREVSFSGVNNYIDESETFFREDILEHGSTIFELERMRIFFQSKDITVDLYCFGNLKNYFLELNESLNILHSLGLKTSVHYDQNQSQKGEYKLVLGEGHIDSNQIPLQIDIVNYNFQELLKELKKSQIFRESYDEYRSLS